MATKKTSKATKIGVMDVSKPGKTTPDASARPIIVGHKPLTEDPMVTKPTSQDSPKEEDAGHKITVSRTAPKVINPISPTDEIKDEVKKDEPPKEEQPEEPTPPEPEKEPEVEKTEETPPASEAATETPPEPEPESEPSTDEEATVDAVAGQAPDKKSALKEAEADLKQEEHFQELIANKKYYLPIRASARRRRAGWIVLVLLIVLLLGGAYGMLYTDMGMDWKRPTWLGGPSQTAEEMPHEDEHDDTSEPKTVASSARDTERRADINAIRGSIESYFNLHGYYPTLSQLNDPAFRASDLKLDEDTYQDPDGTSQLLAVTPSSGMYGYATTPATCDNENTDCISFVLGATLSDDSTFEKTSP